jgi:hypothetical protein
LLLLNRLEQELLHRLLLLHEGSWLLL